MLQPDQEGEVPFKTAIKCASAVLLNKIVTSETDLVGIVLYGTVSGSLLFCSGNSSDTLFFSITRFIPPSLCRRNPRTPTTLKTSTFSRTWMRPMSTRFSSWRALKTVRTSSTLSSFDGTLCVDGLYIIYLLEHLDSFNFDEEIGTSNGKYTLGEMFWTATNLFGAR